MTAALMGPWVLWDGWRHWRRGDGLAVRRAGAALMICVVLAGIVSVLYFVGYERPGWAPPSPGKEASLETAARIMSYAFGPAAMGSWTLAIMALAAIVTLALLVLVNALLTGPAEERPRAAGLLSFILVMLVLGLLTGHARAGWVLRFGYPHRYALLFTPILAAAYLAWLAYGLPRLRPAVIACFAIGMLLLVPFNIKRGFHFRDWYTYGMAQVEQDIAAGLTAEQLAQKHGQFLLHWDEKNLVWYIQLLRDARMTPFKAVPKSEGP